MSNNIVSLKSTFICNYKNHKRKYLLLSVLDISKTLIFGTPNQERKIFFKTKSRLI